MLDHYQDPCLLLGVHHGPHHDALGKLAVLGNEERQDVAQAAELQAEVLVEAAGNQSPAAVAMDVHGEKAAAEDLYPWAHKDRMANGTGAVAVELVVVAGGEHRGQVAHRGHEEVEDNTPHEPQDPLQDV